MSDTARRPASSAAAPGYQGEDEIMAEPDSNNIQNLLPTVLSRLAAGLPMHELRTIIKEACACEDAL